MKKGQIEIMGVISGGQDRQQLVRRVAVRGGGIVGRCLAMLLAKEGIDVVLAERFVAADEQSDPRAYALNAASVRLLQGLRVWPADVACPVDEMLIQGDKGGRLNFSAWRQATDVLAYIVPAVAVEQMLEQALTFQPRIERVDADALPALPDIGVTVICEGRDSITRKQWGFEMDVRPYGHTALAARILCSKEHDCKARQWFRRHDVLALLPVRGGREVSMVWSMPDGQAARFRALSAADFQAELMAAAPDVLGNMVLQTPMAAWGLRYACARHWFMHREDQAVVLAGDAAHAMHPLAGQGLNVGLGDVVELAKLWREAPAWRSLGDQRILRSYERARRAAFMKMGGACDVIFDVFMNTAAPARAAVNMGMSVLDGLSPLKSWLAAQAKEV